MENPKTDLERAEYLQDMLLTHATGGAGDNDQYKALRKHFLDNRSFAKLIPAFVRSNRDLFQFWQFIKHKFGSYAERREFIWQEFAPLLEYIESSKDKPSDQGISNRLQSFDADGVHEVWTRALERRTADPEGAITISRTLLETVCKQILEKMNVKFDEDRTELPDLYRMTSQALKLAPSQHTQDTFKKILGGVTSVVNELGSLRNRIGDAHGKGSRRVRPAIRHAELAVNLAGAIALFLIQTWEARNN
jgi:Abortive infection C-terminus